MSLYQTRYTYPMVRSANLYLKMRFNEKYHRFFTGTTSLVGGARIEDIGANVNHEIKIYRFDGRTTGRFNIVDYDPDTRVWTDDQPESIDAIMRMQGFSLVWEDDSTNHPLQFTVDAQGREIDYRLDTTNPAFRTPALYVDVWYVQIVGEPTMQDGRTLVKTVPKLGPIKQYFRLEPRVWAPTYEPLSFWFDLRLWPSNVPWGNSGYPIAISVQPIVKNIMNRMPLQAYKSILSCATVQLVDGYLVEDEDGNKIRPPVYRSFGVTLNDQIFNTFFGSWDTRGFAAGKYSIRMRITLNPGPGGPGTMNNSPSTSTDMWKRMTIVQKYGGNISAAPEIPYGTLSGLTSTHYLWPYTMEYDGTQFLFENPFVGTWSHYHEPRVQEPAVHESNNPTPVYVWHTDVAAASTSLTLNHIPALDTSPFVVWGSKIKRPSVPIDGSGTVNDFWISGKTLYTPSATGYTVINYLSKSYDPQSVLGSEYFEVGDAVSYLGDNYFVLDTQANISWIDVYTQDTRLLSGTNYTLITSGAVYTHFGAVALKFTAAQLVDVNYWLTVDYAHVPKSTSFLIATKMRHYEDESTNVTITLPRYLNASTITLSENGDLKVATTNYTFTKGSYPDYSTVTMLNGPRTTGSSSYIQIWCN